MLDREARVWLRQFFWQAPRPHGEAELDRTVSFLELFYDLVYVVVIARAAHHLATHLSWDGVVEFIVVFAFIWLAWINGTLQHELHGRQDVRSRLSIFAQMILMAVLGVYTAEAGGADGASFALVYSVLFLLFTVLWLAVWRQDSAEYRPTAGRYVAIMVVSTIAMFSTVFMSEGARSLAWKVILVALFAAMGWMSLAGRGIEISITESLVERFGLFMIIVLGEVVVGVVEGLSEADRGVRTIVVGVLALMLGFGFWWSYFDFAGRRLPLSQQPSFGIWMFAHFPVSLATAAAGAGMVDLVAHATDARTSAATAWLVGGSAAVMLIGLTVIVSTLQDYVSLGHVYRPVSAVMLGAAAVSLVVAALRPSPAIFVFVLGAILSIVWWTGVLLFARGRVDAAAASA